MWYNFAMKNDLESLAINIVRNEVQAYENPEVFITDKVSFAVRPLIRKLRKNYWGVFDEPKDKITGKDKVWAPLTRLVVDNTRKNVDLDSKDINFHSNKSTAFGITQLFRAFIRNYLNKTYYGEDMDDVTFSVCVDPVAVMKIVPVKRDGKTHIDRFYIDPLNCYIDPTVESIQKSYRFTERSLLTKDQMKGMKGWINIQDAVPTEGAIQRDLLAQIHAGSTTKYVDVYEMWGKIPKKLIDASDSDEEVDGHVVVSGLDGGNPVLHLIEKNTHRDADGNVIKPYEEARYMKIPWSWYGVSPAMMVMDIQEWMNTIINLRINKNTIAQLGLFKVRTGSNINTQALTRLVSNGVIKVTNMDDLDNFQIPEAGPGSYKDEDTAKSWATEVTSAYDVVRGTLPSTSTATAAVIQDRNAKSSFVIVRDALGRFNEKVIQRHVLPYMPKMIKEEGIVRYFSDTDEIDIVRERIVAELAMQNLKKMNGVPTEEELMRAMKQAENKLREQKDLFFEVIGDLSAEGLDTEVRVTNEKLDVGTTARNLLELIQLIPEQARGETAAQIFDILGLRVPNSLSSMPTQQANPQLAIPNELGQFTEANTKEVIGQM